MLVRESRSRINTFANETCRLHFDSEQQLDDSEGV